ncbi:ATP-binding protein [Natronomonas moolapensis]|nr:ATP-binding protein [Natronomonas moolapensis]
MTASVGSAITASVSPIPVVEQPDWRLRARHDSAAAVFEPGYSTTVWGSGFGLAIARETVEAHGRELRVTDSVEGGARIEITGVGTK